MPVFAPPYNPRARYLSALGAAPGFYPPAARAIPTLFAHRSGPQRRRLRLGYNPRARYLTGLGQDDGSDSSSFDWSAAAASNASTLAIPSEATDYGLNTISPASAPDIGPIISSQTPTSLVPAGTYGSVVAPNTSVTYTPSGGMIVNVPQPSASIITGSTGGVPNSLILIGLAGIVVLAALSSGGSSRR